MSHVRVLGMLGLAAAITICTSCSAPEAPKAKLPPPIVTVALPTTGKVMRYEYFTGRVEPNDRVEIRARVSGYLTKIYFKPGTEVKKGDPLFDIDPDPFKAELDRAEAEVAQTDARSKRTALDLRRMTALRKTNAASQEDLDKASSDNLEAEANLKASQAKLTTAKLNLGYAKITAPIDGMIGDKLVSEGNLVAGGQGTTTLLADIVAVDPIAIGFDVDENTFQRLQREAREGKIPSQKQIPIEAGLAVHGSEYPLTGLLNFFDNKVDPKTGTIHLKGEFANPLPSGGGRILSAGMFVRVRIPIGTPQEKMLVPESALGSDQGNRFLMGVNAENKAVRLEAEVGIAQGRLRVIEAVRGPGESAPRPLQSNELIIVDGLQRVRPGMVVDPQSIK